MAKISHYLLSTVASYLISFLNVRENSKALGYVSFGHIGHRLRVMDGTFSTRNQSDMFQKPSLPCHIPSALHTILAFSKEKYRIACVQ